MIPPEGGDRRIILETVFIVDARERGGQGPPSKSGGRWQKNDLETIFEELPVINLPADLSAYH